MGEQEHLPSIRDVCQAVFYLENKYMKEGERKNEDLNDKKAAWLLVALEKGLKNLNLRDREFAERYLNENIHFSPLFMFKPWLNQFIEQQRIRYSLRKE